MGPIAAVGVLVTWAPGWKLMPDCKANATYMHRRHCWLECHDSLSLANNPQPWSRHGLTGAGLIQWNRFHPGSHQARPVERHRQSASKTVRTSGAMSLSAGLKSLAAMTLIRPAAATEQAGG